MNKAEEVFGVVFVASDDAAEVVKPGKEALYLPASAIATKRPSVLSLGSTVAAMWCDQFDAPLGQPVIERVGVVGTIADQFSRLSVDEAVLERRLDEFNLMR